MEHVKFVVENSLEQWLVSCSKEIINRRRNIISTVTYNRPTLRHTPHFAERSRDSKRKTKTNFSCDNYFLLLVQRISVFFRGMDFNCLKYRNLIPFDLIWYSLRPVLRTLSRTSLKRVFAMHDFGSAQSNHKLMDAQRYCVEVGLHTCYHTFVYVVVFFVIFWYPYNFHEALDL